MWKWSDGRPSSQLLAFVSKVRTQFSPSILCTYCAVYCAQIFTHNIVNKLSLFNTSKCARSQLLKPPSILCTNWEHALFTVIAKQITSQLLDLSVVCALNFRRKECTIFLKPPWVAWATSNKQQVGTQFSPISVHDLHFLGDVSNKHQQLLDSLTSVHSALSLKCTHSIFNRLNLLVNFF